MTTPTEPNDEQEAAVVPVDTDETAQDNTPAEDVETETEADTDLDAEDDDAAEDDEDDGADEDDEEDLEVEDFEDFEDEARAGSETFAKVVAFALLPALALLLGAGAGFLKWRDDSVRSSEVAAIESTQVAKDSTVKLLSYKPDTVEQELGAAKDLLTGSFRDSYTQLTNDTVIPGSKEQQISAVASVPAAASISATPNRAEALVFVNQSVIVGDSAPTATASSVKVTLDKVGDRWLISGFDPV